MKMELFSPNLTKIWKEWELRMTILLSLALQIVLTTLGSRRKYNHKPWMTIVLWCVYLAANYIATVSLGIISNNLADMYNDSDNAGDSQKAKIELTAFWAPFLLLHLGGPDTITSYSLEDNELWLRHMLGLFVQTGVVVYVIFKAWTDSYLSFLSIPLFITGFIKYGERIWALKSASNDGLRERFKRIADKDDDDHVTERFLEEQKTKNDEGYTVEVGKIPTIEFLVDVSTSNISEEDKLVTAFTLREVTMNLFLDTILSSAVKDATHYLFKTMSIQNAFHVIEMEIGFAYDLLYTKASLIYTRRGLFLRPITFSLTCLVLALFTCLDHNEYKTVDLFVTTILLGLAIMQEIYGVLLLLSSDRFVVWLWRHNKTSKFHVPTTCFPLFKNPSARWSKKVAQYSLLNFIIKKKSPPCRRILKPFKVEKKLEKGWNITHVEIHEGFKEWIFNYFKVKAEKAIDNNSMDGERRNYQLAIASDEAPNFGEDFSKCIVFWHFVTEGLYYLDKPSRIAHADTDHIYKLLKQISRYMLYLLVVHPSMLSIGMTEITFEEVAATLEVDLREYIKKKSTTQDRKTNVYKKLVQKDSIGRPKRGVLSYAHSYLKNKKDQEKTKKWKEIKNAWLEMLAYAACKCKGNLHAQQLRRGGELLTHVWLLMAHFGLTNHYQTAEDLRVARLVVE